MSEETPTKKLTDAQWAEIVTLYELGEHSAADLSKRFGVTPSALSQHFKKNGIVKGSRSGEIAKAVEKEVKAAHVAAVVTFESKRRQRIEETRENTYLFLDNISKSAMKLLVEAGKASLPPASVYADLKALRLAAAIVEQTRVGRLDVLQANRDIDEESLPNLVIDDLTDDDIKAHHARNEAESDDDILPSVDDEDEIISEEDDEEA